MPKLLRSFILMILAVVCILTLLIAWRIATVADRSIHRFVHENAVAAAAFSPDGLYLATVGDQNCRLNIWSVATGEQVNHLSGCPDDRTWGFTSVTYSPNGDFVAVTRDWSGDALILDLDSEEVVQRLVGHRALIRGASYSPDGNHIVTFSDDGDLRIWDTTTGTEIQRLVGHTDLVTSAVYSPEGDTILTASFDRTARLWDAATGEELLRFGDYETTIFHASFSSDGDYIVTGDANDHAYLWDTHNGLELAEFTDTSWVMSVFFTRDGNAILTSTWINGDITIWDVATEQPLRHMSVGQQASLLAYNPNRKYIVTAIENVAKLWALE